MRLSRPGLARGSSNLFHFGAFPAPRDSTSPAFHATIRSAGGKGPAITSIRDTTEGGHEGPCAQPCLALLFAPGGRPAAEQVRAALTAGAIGEVSFDPARTIPPTTPSDWLEVLIDGLTFDVLGLAPGHALTLPPPRHRLGLAPSDMAGSEAIGLAPGPHLAGAANALPVVRTLLRLGTAVARHLPGTLGVHWLPSGSATGRAIFLETVEAWLAGGAFPVPVVAGFETLRDGSLASDGLAFFTGQEFELDPALCTDRLAATRVGIRLFDRLVEHHPLHGVTRLALEDGGRIRLVGDGRIVKVAPG